jgi:phosphate starvation-inducible membrane PsiE
LGFAERIVLVLIGIVLVLLAISLLMSSIVSLYQAVMAGNIRELAIEILDGVLLVMMTMEIVYTVTVSLESHKLVAEPFLIIGLIAAIRRMLVITATNTEQETNPAAFHNTLVELGLLGGMVLILALAIYVLRRAQTIPVPTGREDAGGSSDGEDESGESEEGE